MVINMDESRLRTIEQIEQFLSASTLVAFSRHADDIERYEHITRVLKRFDYPQRNKRERGVLLRYLRHTSGYSRPQVTRLVAQWAQEPPGNGAPCQTLLRTWRPLCPQIHAR